jgi:hypothetical protein
VPVSYESAPSGLLFTIGGEEYRTGRAGQRCFEDVRNQFGEDAALVVAAEAATRMSEVRLLWPGSRRPNLKKGQYEINVNGFLLALGFGPERVEDLAARYRSGTQAHVDLGAAGASLPDAVGSTARGSPLFDGSDEDVKGHLESIFGTSAFRLVGRSIELELPDVGRDRRPRPSGESRTVRFDAPKVWGVQAPEGGRWWHVVAEGASATLCTVPLDSWTTTARRDDNQTITCPWCRVRMIAIEIAAPPAPGIPDEMPEESPTLHDEIARILAARGGWMTTEEIAREVARAGCYRKRDGTSNVTAFQVHGRTKNYLHLFERDGSRVRIRGSA